MTHPKPEEYAPYFETYISKVPEGDILDILEEQTSGALDLLEAIPEEKQLSSYAPGKWTIKECVGHIIDAERIFAYRMLRIARKDQTPLPGFEQDDYVAASDSNSRDWEDLLEEYESVRMATLSLVRQIKGDVWDRSGTASGNKLTVRAAAYIIAGHERHHLLILRDKYGCK
jgi:DinB superfamily